MWKSKPLSVVALTSLFLGTTTAFWEFGHIFVARVAYDQLQFSREGRDALAKANDLLRVYSSSNQSMIRSEHSYPFVECATFADQIKETGQKWQNNWHFIDTPYLDEGGNL
jgi:hypothetical protein